MMVVIALVPLDHQSFYALFCGLILLTIIIQS